jgi:outer membrane protein assembly factor BamB
MRIPASKFLPTICCGLFFWAITTGRAAADDWPQWMGADRQGVWKEELITAAFPADGPKTLWRTEVGAGYSGPAVANGRVLLMDRQLTDPEAKPNLNKFEAVDGSERVLCFDADYGKLLWKHEYDCKYAISYPNGPRTTPTIDGERIFCLGAMGNLTCLNAEDGTVVWSCDFMERFKFERPPAWGWAASPLVVDDMLICVVGGKGAGVVAFDKKTGETIWQAIDTKEMGYASPLLFERDGKRQLIVWYDVGLAGLDLNNGSQFWDLTFPEDGPVMRPAVTISHPRLFIDADDQAHVVVSDFYHGTAVIHVSADPPDADLVWSTPKGTGTNKESLNTLMAAPLVKDNHIFGFDGNGELRCITLDEGENVWRQFGPNGKRRATFATTFIIPNGELHFLYNDQGELIIATLNSEGYEELDRAKILETTSFARGRDVVWSHPAFAYRHMFARNDKELVCVDLEATPASDAG